MDPLSLFTLAFGLPAPWEVVDVAFDPKSGRTDFHRAFAPGTRFSCPHCGAEHQPAHDTLERDWRHLNFFQFQAYIHAKVPRVRCGTYARLLPGRGALGTPQQRLQPTDGGLTGHPLSGDGGLSGRSIAWRQRRARPAPRPLRRSGARSGGLLDRHLGWSRRDRLAARTQLHQPISRPRRPACALRLRRAKSPGYSRITG